MSKIKWKRGMEITPDTFEHADSHWTASDGLLRRLIVLQDHGLVPGVPKNTSVSIVDDRVSVCVHQFEGIAPTGLYFQIVEDSITLNLPQNKGRECYLVVYSENETEKEVNGISYTVPRYSYDYCTINEIGRHCLPFAKLVKEDNSWHIQEKYIPPCMTVGADPGLEAIVYRMRHAVSAIMKYLSDRLPKKDLFAFGLMVMELQNYRMSETPSDFYMLLNKMAFSISQFSVSGLLLPPLPAFQPYDANDLLKCFGEVVRFIDDCEQASKNIETPVAVPEQPSEDKEVIVWDAVIP